MLKLSSHVVVHRIESAKSRDRVIFRVDRRDTPP